MNSPTETALVSEHHIQTYKKLHGQSKSKKMLFAFRIKLVPTRIFKHKRQQTTLHQYTQRGFINKEGFINIQKLYHMFW